MVNCGFAEQIKSQRLALKHSQQEVARVVGISTTYLARLESGRAIPPPRETSERLLHALQFESGKQAELLQIAAHARGSTEAEEKLPKDVRLLLTEIRRRAHAMPAKFVRGLRTAVREVED